MAMHATTPRTTRPLHPPLPLPAPLLPPSLPPSCPPPPSQVDSSGMQLYYTRNLRPHDMGMLVLGTQNITIPAAQASVTTYPSVCSGACTLSRLPGPLTLTSITIHMHQTGHSAITRVFRNGTELQPLPYRSHYSFFYQVWRGGGLWAGLWVGIGY